MIINILEKEINSNTGFSQYKISILNEQILKAKQILFKNNKFKIQGFRSKTISTKILNNLYDKNFLLYESIEFLLEKSYKEIESNEKISILSKITIEKIEEINDDNTIITISFVTNPKIKFIENYKKINNLKLSKVTVNENEIEHALNNILNKHAEKIIVTERPIQQGDIVNLDFEGYVNNEKFNGGSAKNYELTIGSNEFIPGFEEQLVGTTTGQNINVEVIFPESYHVDELKSKPAIFKCKINNIFIKKMPEVTNEFVKKISEFNTLNEFKENLSKQIFEYKNKENEQNFENDLINKIFEIIDPNIVIPQILIDEEVNIMIENFKNKLSQQNMKINDYLKMMNTNLDGFKNMLKKDAEKNIKVRFALEKISENENIEINNKEIEEFYDSLDKTYKFGKDKLKLFIDEKKVIFDKKISKTIIFLKKIYTNGEIND